MSQAGLVDILSVRLKNVTLGYQQTSILDGISLDLPQGRCVRVGGYAGSGKSAVLKLLAGLITPISGEYLINENPVNQMSFEEFLKFRLNIGYSFDLGGLLNNRTLKENLTLPLEYHNRFSPTLIKEKLAHFLEIFNLGTVADRRPSAVSGSQRKACCVARALMMEPQMLIMDDPATGLGAAAVQALADHVTAEMKSGGLKFVVLATDDAALQSALNPMVLEIRQQWLEWAA